MPSKTVLAGDDDYQEHIRQGAAQPETGKFGEGSAGLGETTGEGIGQQQADQWSGKNAQVEPAQSGMPSLNTA